MYQKYKIIVWGTGVGAAQIFNQYFKSSDVACYVDSNPNVSSYLGREVVSPESLCDMQYDLILVASNSSYEIFTTCQKLMLDMTKIYFVYRHFYPLVDMNEKNENVLDIMGEEWLRSMAYEYEVITRNPYEFRERKKIPELEQSWIKKRDFVRIETLELISKEVQDSDIQGAVAELGVYKGEFSRCLNLLFRERPLYLFDTFQSFGEKEFLQEKEKNNCNDEFIEAFKDTHASYVYENMPFKEMVYIIQGLFPQSIHNHSQILQETFAVVSLDVDFEESIYQGLEFFYPRLSSGGYILIHDYNSKLRGVRDAIKRYEEKGGKLCKVPLCDEFGTLVITKI